MKKYSSLLIAVAMSSISSFAGYMINHPTKVDNNLKQRNRIVTQGNEQEYSNAPSREAATRDSVTKGEIARVQTALKNRGYNVGAIDGVMGKRTRDSLMTFQATESLEITGELNQDTLNSLGVYSVDSEKLSE